MRASLRGFPEKTDKEKTGKIEGPSDREWR
jgi:hypothetical protein